jgi:dihydroneopterin aldolase
MTLEAFATHVARVACYVPGADRVSICVEKPRALAYAAASGVEITRDRAFFESWYVMGAS